MIKTLWCSSPLPFWNETMGRLIALKKRSITIGFLCCFLLFPVTLAHGKEFIDLFCPNIERKEAILTCAFQAQVEVVFLEPVLGKVNLRKNRVPFEEALSLILKGSGISWFRAGNIYYIGTPSPETFAGKEKIKK